MVAGALTNYNLPDLIGCLAPRKVALIDPKTENTNRWQKIFLRRELRFPSSVYESNKASVRFDILQSDSSISKTVAWYFD